MTAAKVANLLAALNETLDADRAAISQAFCSGCRHSWIQHGGSGCRVHGCQCQRFTAAAGAAPAGEVAK